MLMLQKLMKSTYRLQNSISRRKITKTHFLLRKYLTQNPTGEGLYQAKYELGESYYQTNNSTKALLVLQEVANVQNDYQDDAQTRLAQIFVTG
jgi:hypothetical protein